MINSFSYIDYFIIMYLNSFIGCLFVGLIFWITQKEFDKKRCHSPYSFYDRREFFVNSILFALGCFGAIKMYLLITNHSFIRIGLGESVGFEISSTKTSAFYFEDDFTNKKIEFKCEKIVDVHSLNRCAISVNKVLAEYSTSHSEKFVSWYPKYLLGATQKIQVMEIVGNNKDVDMFVDNFKKNEYFKKVKINIK